MDPIPREPDALNLATSGCDVPPDAVPALKINVPGLVVAAPATKSICPPLLEPAPTPPPKIWRVPLESAVETVEGMVLALELWTTKFCSPPTLVVPPLTRTSP